MPTLPILPILALWLAAAPVAWASQSNPCVVADEIAIKAIALLDAKPEDALKALHKAYEICKTDVAIGFNLGLAQYRTGDKNAAMKTWTTLLETFPDHAKTQANLAWLKFETGDDKKALQLASEGFVKHPGNLAMAHTKIFALLRKGQYLEAYDWIMRMREQEKEEPGAGLGGDRVERWRQMAAEFVMETLWRQFRRGDGMDALRQSINLLIKEYPAETLFMRTKDQLVQAFADPDAEIPFPRPLPHEAWPKTGDIDNRNAMLDDRIASLPVLADWRKRPDAYAVVAGISHYHRIRARHYADRDAGNLHRLLTRRGVFKEDVDHTRLRVNAAADARTLKSDLEWLIRQGELNPNAMLLFYFSGLGQATPDGGDGLLLPADARLPQLDADHAISLKWLKSALARLPNKEVAILLDVCFNNTPGCSISDKTPANPPEPGLTTGGKPMAVAAWQKEAATHGPGQQGAFTWHLLDGLLGNADGVTGASKDGWVDLAELFAFLKTALAHHDPPSDPLFSVPTGMRLTRTGGEQ
ncbi:MAG: caspase family protein [Magnetococcales bacterium]|nr:caspase family protein [Magnetococcales bacterium]